MRPLSSALRLGALLVLTACGGSAAPEPPVPAPPTAPVPVPAAAPAPAPEAPPAPPSHASKPFKIEVVLDDPARAELERRGEGIVVDVVFVDTEQFGDDQGYRRVELTLGPAGGVVDVPATDLSPAKAGGGPLGGLNVNVYSARKTDENNLLSCEAHDVEVTALPAQVTVRCSLI
jgi:hypothetical protein